MIEIRDNLLVTAGARAAYMDVKGVIDIPGGLDGEDKLAEAIVNMVRTYMKLPDDIPFDEFIETELKREFGKKTRKRQPIEMDDTTKEWFKYHPEARTTVALCEKCGLYYKPSLGHKCKYEW